MNLNKLFIIGVAMLVTGLQAKAQNGSIAGVINGADGIPLQGITIRIESLEKWAITNPNGAFLITGLHAGNYVVSGSSVGYQTFSSDVVVIDDQTTNFSFVMKEAVMDLPEVVISNVTMTGGYEGIMNVQGSASYISPKQLQKFNYSDINRTLMSVAGVNLQEEDGFGLRPNIGLRGTGVERSSKITIMEDGILMAPAPYSSPAAYYFPTISRMQAVEIMKGSSQIKYGPFTTGGAINFISNQIPDETSGRIIFSTGTFNSKKLHAFAGSSFEQVGFLVEANHLSSDGFKLLDNGGPTGFEKTDYLAKLRLNTAEDARVYQSLTFKAGVVSENSNETYLGLTYDDFNEDPFRRYAASQMDEMITNQTQLSARYVAEFSKNFNLTSTIYRNDFSRNWYKLDNVKDSLGVSASISNILEDPETYSEQYDIITGETNVLPDALGVKANNRNYYAEGIETILSYQFQKGTSFHDLQFGVRLHRDEMDRFQWLDKFNMQDGVMELTSHGIEGTESNQIVNAKAFASYLQYQLKAGKFTMTPGLRYESISVTDHNYGKTDPDRIGTDLETAENEFDVWIPGAGIDYKLNDHQRIFAGVHKGFSPAGAQEDAQPEESINYEVGTRYNYGFLKGQLVMFYNDYSNLLGADLAAAGGTGSGDLFNGGEAVANGIEVEVIYNPLYGRNEKYALQLSIAYTYTEAHFMSSFESTFEDWGDVEKGDRLPYLSPHQLSTQLSLEHARFSVNLNGKYNSDMRSKAGQGEIPSDELVPAYFILDLSAAYHITPEISICGSITNITDNTYIVAIRPAGYRPGMPRAVNAGLKVYF